MGASEMVGGAALIGAIGEIFGGRRDKDRGGNNFDINELIEIEKSREKQFRDLMEENQRHFEEKMGLLNDEINSIKERNNKIIQDLKDEIKKKEEEYKNKELERKAKKENKQKQANEQLINDINSSRNSILQEIEKEFDDLQDIYCVTEIEKNIKISDELEELYLNLFQSENISQLFLNIILEKIKSFNFNKKISCYNIQIIGATGVGKSTLINTLLRKKLSPTSFGRIGTFKTDEYFTDKFPFIRFIDTRGIELSNTNNIEVVKENTLDYIEKRLSEEDPNRTIHCLLYCIQGNRFQNIEKEVLCELRKNIEMEIYPLLSFIHKIILKKTLKI